MRYQNWDVLLFPGDSRIPIQEFDTKCYTLEQNVSVSAAQPATEIDPNAFESMTVVPILTCFVASLERGAAFRVSIHSWDKARPSNLLLNYKTLDEPVLFQSRVYIDGVSVAHRTFEGGIWPEGIKVVAARHTVLLEAKILEHGDQRLRFPPFHKEILQQPHWDPGESLGRIKVVISEGVLRETTPPAPLDSMFDRLRDVVIFSFQHAPQNILEFSSIAWPNMKMFKRNSRRAIRPGPIGTRLPPVPGHEAHSHSPLRPCTAARGSKAHSNGLDRFQKLLDAQMFSDLQSDPPSKASAFAILEKESPERRELVSNAVTCEDPFICPHPISSQQWRLQLRSSSHDVAMPDYTSNKTDNSGACTEMSGISFARANFLKHMNEANPQEIVQALSPARQDELLKALSASHSPVQGTQAPTNTPRSVSDQSHPRSPLGRGGAEMSHPVKVAVPAGRGDSSDGHWPRQLQKRDQRRRTYSESSIISTSAPVKVDIKQDVDAELPREWVERGEKTTFGSLGTTLLCLNTNRRASTSNVSKRKRRSATPAPDMGMGRTKDAIQVVVVDSSSSGGGQQTVPRKATPARSDGEVAQDDD